MSDYCVSPDACHPERPFFVATVSYTAACPEGTSGSPVTKTAQCESVVSYLHARGLARDKAKCEAEAALACLFAANRCVIPVCEPEHPGFCAEGTGLTQSLAEAAALAAAQALATAFCEEPTASYVFDFGNSTIESLSVLNVALKTGGDVAIDDFDFTAGVDYETDGTLDFTAQVLANPTTGKIIFTLSGPFDLALVSVDPALAASSGGYDRTLTLSADVDTISVVVRALVIEN